MFLDKMKNNIELSKSIFFPSLIIIIFFFEIILNGSISDWFLNEVKRIFQFSPLLTWPFGVLIGHWYHPNIGIVKIKKNDKRIFWILIISLIIISLSIIITFTLLYYLTGFFFPQWVQSIFLLVGYILGWILWPVSVSDEHYHLI